MQKTIFIFAGLLFAFIMMSHSTQFAKTVKTKKVSKQRTPANETISPQDILIQDSLHCHWAEPENDHYSHNKPHIGKFNICRSKTNKTLIYFQAREPITESQLCFIPTSMHRNSPVRLGQTECLWIKTADKIYPIHLKRFRYRNRKFDFDSLYIMKNVAHFYPAPFYQYLLAPDAFTYCTNWQEKENDSSYCMAWNKIEEFVFYEFNLK